MRQAQAIDNQHGALMRIGNKLAATLKRAEAAEAEVKRLREALQPLVRPHCGLCVPVDDQGRLGEVTPESCVCDPAQKRARAALAAAKGASEQFCAERDGMRTELEKTEAEMARLEGLILDWSNAVPLATSPRMAGQRVAQADAALEA